MAQMSSKKYVYLLIFVSFTLMFFSSSVKNVFRFGLLIFVLLLG